MGFLPVAVKIPPPTTSPVTKPAEFAPDKRNGERNWCGMTRMVFGKTGFNIGRLQRSLPPTNFALKTQSLLQHRCGKQEKRGMCFLCLMRACRRLTYKIESARSDVYCFSKQPPPIHNCDHRRTDGGCLRREAFSLLSFNGW